MCRILHVHIKYEYQSTNGWLVKQLRRLQAEVCRLLPRRLRLRLCPATSAIGQTTPLGCKVYILKRMRINTYFNINSQALRTLVISYLLVSYILLAIFAIEKRSFSMFVALLSAISWSFWSWIGPLFCPQEVAFQLKIVGKLSIRTILRCGKNFNKNFEQVL